MGCLSGRITIGLKGIRRGRRPERTRRRTDARPRKPRRAGARYVALPDGVRQRSRRLRGILLATLLPLLAPQPPAHGQAPPPSGVGTGHSPVEVSAPLSAEEEPLLALAAASLTDVLPRIAQKWEARGGAPVRFSFDATSRLAPQVVEGGRADLFFSADVHWIRWLAQRGALDSASACRVAGNELVLIVPAGAPAPKGPRALNGVPLLALAGENVPAGRYAREALASVGVWDEVAPHVVRGGSVRGVLEWVARGDVPAGVVYATDAHADPQVRVAFTFPPESHEPIAYYGAVLRGSRHPEAAARFLEFVGGAVAAGIFREAGFTPAGSRAAAPAEAPPVEASLPDPWSAVRLSILVALMATLLGAAPAVGFGWLLARREFPGKTAVSMVLLVPLVLPPVVTGFLLLSLLGARSPLGAALAAAGLPVPFTLMGATLAALTVGMPLYVLSVRGAFEAVDSRYEDLSLTLGVPRRATFLRVSLPLALPGIVAGAVLAFARALGEFGATVVLAGNVEGHTRTIALAVYTLLETPSGRSLTWILVGASVLLSLGALIGYETLNRRQRRILEHPRGR